MRLWYWTLYRKSKCEINIQIFWRINISKKLLKTLDKIFFEKIWKTTILYIPNLGFLCHFFVKFIRNFPVQSLRKFLFQSLRKFLFRSLWNFLAQFLWNVLFYVFEICCSILEKLSCSSTFSSNLGKDSKIKQFSSFNPCKTFAVNPLQTILMVCEVLPVSMF